MPLPSLTTDDDVEAICDYLKTKPEGTSIAEALSSLPRALLENRKLEAFELWGFVSRTGDILKLEPLGRDMAETSSDSRYLIFQKLIYQQQPYRAVVEWMFKNDFPDITNIEISSQWHIHFKSDMGTSDENQMHSMATCFLQICQAAGFGSLAPGRSSGTNKFSINKSTLGRFFTETVKIFDKHISAEPAGRVEVVGDLPEIEPAVSAAVTKFDKLQAPGSAGPRIYISPPINEGMTEQIITLLEVEKFDYAASKSKGTQGAAIDAATTELMRKCDSAIIFVNADETQTLAGGKHPIEPDTLMELGAALTLYNQKVVLLYDTRVELPASLKSLPGYEFTGSELSWNAGVNLMKAVAKFRD